MAWIDRIVDEMKVSDVLYWKLAVWKLYYGCLTVVIGAIPATLLNWYQMNMVEKVISVAGIMLALHKFVDGFLDQTLSRLIAGKPPIQLPGMNGNDKKGTEFIVAAKIHAQPTTTQPP